HATRKREPMFTRDRLEGAQRIGDDELWKWARNRTLDDCRNGSLLRRSSKVVMAVAPVGPKRDKRITRAKLPAVDGETRDRSGRLHRPSAGRPSGKGARIKSWHGTTGGLGGRTTKDGTPPDMAGHRKKATVAAPDHPRGAMRLMPISSRTTCRSSNGTTVSANS